MTRSHQSVWTQEDYDNYIEAVRSRPVYEHPTAFAICLASHTLVNAGEPEVMFGGAQVLDTWYPHVNLMEHFDTAAVLADVTGHSTGSASRSLSRTNIEMVLRIFGPLEGDGKYHPNIEILKALHQLLTSPDHTKTLVPQTVVVTFIGSLDDPPVDVHDCYLRLHLLSHRRVQPRSINLSGLIGLLPNVLWTSEGPLAPETFEMAKLQCLARGVHLRVFGVDKFPHMTDYVVPSGVRVADASRVRLGAHLAKGTTVMQEGFCNFNAGTLGPSMVEGRISQGVLVGAGSDIGGGASIMGTLSGGGKEVITIGDGCLLGANSGTGISLGPGCQVQQGVYVLSNGPIRLQPEGTVVRTWELSGRPNLRYWRNSLTGELEAGPTKAAVQLNPELHTKQ